MLLNFIGNFIIFFTVSSTYTNPKMSNRKILTYNNEDAILTALCKKIETVANDAINSNNVFKIGLSGECEMRKNTVSTFTFYH